MPGIEDMQELIALLREDVNALKDGNARIEQQIATLMSNLPVLQRGISDADYRAADRAQQQRMGAELEGCPVAGGEHDIVSAKVSYNGGPFEDFPVKKGGPR